MYKRQGHRRGFTIDLIELSLGFCLLYTSDAADEGLGVDLGGRRIIKKKIKEGSVEVVGVFVF